MSYWLIRSVLVNPPEHAQHERAEALGWLWVKIKDTREPRRET